MVFEALRVSAENCCTFCLVLLVLRGTCCTLIGSSRFAIITTEDHISAPRNMRATTLINVATRGNHRRVVVISVYYILRTYHLFMQYRWDR
jgi:hypothetical protein